MIIRVLAFVILLGICENAYSQPCNASETMKLLASDGASHDRFGFAVSMDGDTAVVGSHKADIFGEDSGAAYVFVLKDGVWIEQAKLLPDDGEAEDNFGVSVSIDGDTIVVGAYDDDDRGIHAGSVYVFSRSSGVWNQSQKLLASDGARQDFFGGFVSISGDMIAVGAHGVDDLGSNSGSVYIFTRSAGVWSETAKLHADDGVASDRFGDSVCISSHTLIVGAPKDDDPDESGSAYIFVLNNGLWVQQAKITAPDGMAGDRFGHSVSLWGDIGVVGAYRNDPSGKNSGAAYVYKRVVDQWSHSVKLIASDGDIGDQFGLSVSVADGRIIVGSVHDDDNGLGSGSAYPFVLIDSVWVEQCKLIGSDIDTDDSFGISVALDNNGLAIIGANWQGANGEGAGAAYIYGLGSSSCPADFTADGVLDIFDVLGFIDAFNSEDSAADFNSDGVFDIFDALGFIEEFNAGCPLSSAG